MDLVQEVVAHTGQYRSLLLKGNPHPHYEHDCPIVTKATFKWQRDNNLSWLHKVRVQFKSEINLTRSFLENDLPLLQVYSPTLQ